MGNLNKLWIYIFCISANTRVIKQSSLQKFQEEMGKVQKDPYRVVMRQSKLPMSLLHDRVKAHVSMKGINLSLLYCRKNDFYFCLVLSAWWYLCPMKALQRRGSLFVWIYILYILWVYWAYEAIYVLTWFISCDADENHASVFFSSLLLGIVWGEMNMRPYFNPHSILTFTLDMWFWVYWHCAWHGRVALCQAWTFSPHNQHDSK